MSEWLKSFSDRRSGLLSKLRNFVERLIKRSIKLINIEFSIIRQGYS